MLKLIIEDDEGRKTVVPFVRDEITIGRQEGNTIRLTERNVSRRHARLLRQAGAVKIEDLGSSNGIKVNGDRISGLVQISDGDLIQIGDYDLAIQREEERMAAANTPMQLPPMRTNGSAAPTARLSADQRETAPTMPALPGVSPISDATPPPRARPEPEEDLEDTQVPRQQSTSVIRIDQVQSNRRENIELDSTQAARLVVINTEFSGREFLVSRTETRIGRVDDNDIFLDHRSLSRTHCKLVREDNGEWRVIDMQSANGLMVNGEPYAQVTLRSGDVIELGHVKMKFIGPGDHFDAPTAAMTVDTAEFEQVGSSKAPIIAVVAAVLVLAIGGGGYAFIRGRATVKPPPPVVAVVEPVKPPVEKPDEPVVETPPDVVEPPAEDASKKALAEAQKALDAMDLVTAERVLKACKVGSEPCPEVTPMLAQVENEKSMAVAVKGAQASLDRQDPIAMRSLLDAAANTKVFKARVTDLESKYKALVEKKAAVAKKPDPVPVVAVKKPDPVVVAPPVAPAVSVTDKLIAEARTQIEEKAYTAALDRLNRCLKADVNNLVCIRLSASTLAKTNDADNMRKAREYYELYVRVAPADDPYVPKVKNILGAQ